MRYYVCELIKKNKKYLVLAIAILIFLGISEYFNNPKLDNFSSRTFFVDATLGNDSNDGLNPQTAWKSVKKVNKMQFDINKDKIIFDKIYINSKFKSGDKILFKRGEVWNEELYILSSGIKDNPIIFGAYGNGKKPLFDGSICISSKCGSNYDWKIYKDNIYQLEIDRNLGVISESEIPLIFVSFEHNKDNFAKMIPGSSLYDYENKILYLWTKKGNNPNDFLIKGSVKENIIRPINSEYFIVRDLEITHAASTCVRPENINNAIFENLEIHNCGGLWNKEGLFYDGNGITIIFNSENILIQNNIIYNVYDSAISPQTFWKDKLLIKNIFIKNNTLFNAPHSVIEIANWANNSLIENIIIENNEIYNRGDSFSERYNLNKPYGGPGILITVDIDKKSQIKKVKIIDNKIFNNTLDGIAIGLNSDSIEIINNNISNNKGSGIIIFDDKKSTITSAYINNNSITHNGDSILIYEDLKVLENNNFILNNSHLNITQQIKKYFK